MGQTVKAKNLNISSSWSFQKLISFISERYFFVVIRRQKNIRRSLQVEGPLEQILSLVFLCKY